jgi:hypothetical protein
MNRRRFGQVALASVASSRLFASNDPCNGKVAQGTHILESVTDHNARYAGAVAVFFTSHFQFTDRDWNSIKEYGNDYHPLAGYYKGDDPVIVKKQLHWMRRAGIDVIVYDAYGAGLWRPTDLPKDKTLKLILQDLANQQNEPRKLKLIIWFEAYMVMPTASEYDFGFSYVKQYLAEKDFYFRYHGKPLVLPYLNTDYIDAVDKVFEKQRDYFEVRPVKAYKSNFWSYIDSYPQQRRGGWMSASPGFDSYLETVYIMRQVHKDTTTPLDQVRVDVPRVDRDGGAYYVLQLGWAKQSNPDIIFVSGWNDWQYGCQIEPAEEYKFLYLDLTSKVLGRRSETQSYRDET